MSDLTNAEKRAIWTDGAKYPRGYQWISDDQLEREALRRYPDPYEPTVVIDTDTVALQRAAFIRGFTSFETMTFSAEEKDRMARHVYPDPEIAHEYSERTK